MRTEMDLQAVSPPSGASLVRCAVCQGEVSPAETIQLKSVVVCAACKPRFVQSLQEGVDLHAFGAYKRRNLVLLGRNTQLPRRCYRCDSRKDVEMVSVKAHHDTLPFAVVLLLFPFFPPILLVQLLFYLHNRVEVETPLCARHRRRIRIARRMAVPLLLLSVVFFAFSFILSSWSDSADFPQNERLDLGSLCMVVAGLSAAFVSALASMDSKIVTVRKIERHLLWLDKSGRAFRKGLQEYTP